MCTKCLKEGLFLPSSCSKKVIVPKLKPATKINMSSSLQQTKNNSSTDSVIHHPIDPPLHENEKTRVIVKEIN